MTNVAGAQVRQSRLRRMALHARGDIALAYGMLVACVVAGTLLVGAGGVAHAGVSYPPPPPNPIPALCASLDQLGVHWQKCAQLI